MVIDTDVLIWYLRGNEKARKAIETLPSFSVSAVTYMELVQGMRNKQEIVTLRRAFADWRTRILPITERISSRAIVYVEQHYLSRSLTCADALIAATVVINGEILMTANTKHYRAIKDIELKHFRP